MVNQFGLGEYTIKTYNNEGIDSSVTTIICTLYEFDDGGTIDNGDGRYTSSYE